MNRFMQKLSRNFQINVACRENWNLEQEMPIENVCPLGRSGDPSASVRMRTTLSAEI